jgi:hypothetical protein
MSLLRVTLGGLRLFVILSSQRPLHNSSPQTGAVESGGAHAVDKEGECRSLTGLVGERPLLEGLDLLFRIPHRAQDFHLCFAKTRGRDFLDPVAEHVLGERCEIGECDDSRPEHHRGGILVVDSEMVTVLEYVQSKIGPIAAIY